MVLPMNVENIMDWTYENLGSSEKKRNNKEIAYKCQKKKTVEMLEAYKEEKSFGEFNTHKTHKGQEKQRKAANKWLDMFGQMAGTTSNKK